MGGRVRTSRDDDAWSVQVVEGHGARPLFLSRVPRAVAEQAVIGYLFDTDAGIGLGGTQDQNGYPRVCVWSEPWRP